MASPFPGMDPYLDRPAVFGDFHDSFILYLREALQPRLPEPYFASTRSGVWVAGSQRFIEPDADIHRRNGGENTGQAMAGGVALLDATAAKPIVIHVPHDERREVFLEILFVQDGERRLVTTLEVLSPTNKTPGEHGRGLYLQKQKELLESQTHFIEIDLLRAGKHSTSVPLDYALQKTGTFDYHVCCHRFDQWQEYFVYPIQLPEPLPIVAIPLLPEDPQVPLDLQQVFNRTYDAVGYGRLINYRTGK